jgi:hypothetical protein
MSVSMVGSPDLNLLLSRYVRLAEFTPDAESSRPLDARRDSLLWLMRSAKILFTAVDVRMCPKVRQSTLLDAGALDYSH